MINNTNISNSLNNIQSSICDNGLLLVDKPVGFTSFDVTRIVGKALGIKKVGHSGTLDKDASGLLLVCFGKATKLLTYLIGLDKRYIGQVAFGAATDTDDAAGNVIARFDGILQEQKCKDALSAQVGTISQVPPNYSSVHVGGKRAYRLARENNPVALKPRQVTVYKLAVTDIRDNVYTIDVSCSSGTYIRSIARDAGCQTGYHAHLCGLRRMSVGPFCVDNAFTIEQIKSGAFSILTPLEAVANIGVPLVEIKPPFVEDFLNGKILSANMFAEDAPDGKAFVRTGKTLLGMINKAAGRYRYEFVYK